MDKEMRDFLTRILNEPGFRALARNDPVKAMADVGYKVPPAEVAKVPKPASLPSDEEIRAFLVLEKNWDKAKACLIWHNICGWPKP